MGQASERQRTFFSSTPRWRATSGLVSGTKNGCPATTPGGAATVMRRDRHLPGSSMAKCCPADAPGGGKPLTWREFRQLGLRMRFAFEAVGSGTPGAGKSAGGAHGGAPRK